ncbi:Protein-disulfide isomerase [Nannocystis exedens]|uniref:Protein-disulfide isomerase n=1 Tax=Nannocystis exedens TaxID=54 RepID=A0A1I1VKD7_9BACT|nr:thioredoxin domain-containing protein [Nannocystis exedens]PCC72610.1 DSBA oxidoreductase [Nannocystis exedens]SFD83381.1 Protein-disulfide isomerase [Nannocystis exedens]
MSDATTPAPTPNKRSPASILVAVLGFAATIGVGFYAGQWVRDRFFVPSAKLEQGDRYRAELRGDEPQLGPSDALVTVVEYSDFQCPFCAKVTDPLKDAMSAYEGDVRLIFKHYPLPGHTAAPPAAQAAWAAHQQGKFWEMHDLLFENQKKLDDKSLEGYAQQLGLDVAKFNADRNSDAAKAAVDSDYASGGKAGATGTPYFLVNGRPYSGSLPAKQWREIFEYEREQARQLESQGIPRAEVYKAMMKDAKAQRGGGGPGKAPSQRDDGPDPSKTYRVPLDARPQWGPDDALVTIVEFSDFQCPFCKRVNASLADVKQNYPNDVRIVFRQRPLAMHQQARIGARAMLAAHRQGKAWEMHDRLFQSPSDMSEEAVKNHAKELGLDVAMFELDLAAAETEQMVKDDEAVANRLKSGGTPSFFINGRYLSGAQPYDAFKALIEEEKAKAQKLVDEGTPRSQVYEKIMAGAEEKPGK